MIPTREQINAKELWTGGQALGGQALGWLLAMRDEIDRLQADLDRANTEAALARDAMAKATTPAPDREAAIRAWKEEALSVLSGEEDFEGYLLLRRSEITKAVALMRSAGDGKALLRELRAWVMLTAYVRERNGLTSYQDGAVTPLNTIAKIDEMMAQPAPSEQPKDAKIKAMEARFNANYRSIHPVEQPAAAVPDDIGLGPVTDEMVQSGIAAVKDGRWITLEQLRKELAPAPDDTRELVAQLADVAAEFFVAPWCDRAKAIAAKLRGGA